MERQLHHRFDDCAGWYRTILCLMCGIIVLSAGCGIGSKAHPGVSPASLLQYDVSYSRGSGLPGNKPADSNGLRLDDFLRIAVTFVPMSRWPETALESVESQTRMITVLPASSAVAAVAGLLRRAQVGVIQSETEVLKHATVRGAAMSLPQETLRGVLPDGVGTSFRIVERPVVAAGAIRKLEIQVRRGPSQGNEKKELLPTAVCLEVSRVATGEWKEATVPEADSAASSGKEQKELVPVASAMLTTETILLKPRDLQEQDRWAVILPSPFDVGGIAAFAALIEVKPPPEKGTGEAVTYAALLRECQDDLRVAEESGPQARSQFDTGRRGIEDAIRLVRSATHGRQALLYLAHETGAPLVEDVALSATDVVVDRLAYAIANDCESGPASEPNTLGWRLQKTAYQLLVELVSAAQARPELEAIVIRYTGEAGRHPAVLKEMVSDARSTADLEQRLLLENFIYLEDLSPAARTRAFAWLTAKGRAPAGYDPLASLQERRSVLNRVMQEQQ